MKRPYVHEIETLSKALLLDYFSIWVCNELFNDYGLDFAITIVENETISIHKSDFLPTHFYISITFPTNFKILKYLFLLNY